eukprot:s902_g13.t1
MDPPTVHAEMLQPFIYAKCNPLPRPPCLGSLSAVTPSATEERCLNREDLTCAYPENPRSPIEIMCCVWSGVDTAVGLGTVPYFRLVC